MKKVVLLFAIVIANSVFTSCTDLEENFGSESSKYELLATGGEDQQDPDEEDDEENDDEIETPVEGN